METTIYRSSRTWTGGRSVTSTDTRGRSVRNAPRFQLTARDVAILEALATNYRALTSFQIAALFFPPSTTGAPSSRCLERLRRLVQAGYLRRLEQPSLLSDGRKPFVYSASRQGAELLAGRLGQTIEEIGWRGTDSQVSPLFLEHLLATNDFRIAVTLAARENSWAIEDWRDDHELRHHRDYVVLHGPHGARERAAVVPDAYFILRTRGHVYRHFVELDRGTVTGQATAWQRRDWARKCRAYQEYVRSGAYEARYGARGLRILAVTTSEDRLRNLKRIAEETGMKSRMWLTTMANVTPETVLTAPKWQVAGRNDRHALVDIDAPQRHEVHLGVDPDA